ncbi:MAG: metal-sensitive transcriptional regulator [Limnochordia bacterium]|jgi:DNA-binding FrmR family transcriptional regulator
MDHVAPDCAQPDRSRQQAARSEPPAGCPLCHSDPSWGDYHAMLPRLRRIEGQVRGIQRMIEEKRYCVDILTQISAVQAALRQVSLAILDEHTKGCVSRAIKEDRGEETVDELLAVIKRLL